MVDVPETSDWLTKRRRPLENNNFHCSFALYGLNCTDGPGWAHEWTDFPCLDRAILMPHFSARRYCDYGQFIGSQTRARACLIETAGATLLYLPPYSPGLNPIEMAFSKLKSLLRKTAARTVQVLEQAIAQCLDAFSFHECQNFFKASGYKC